MARELGEVLRTVGLRSTPGRRDVLRMIEDSPLPLSHGDVMQRLPPTGADRATVFRILNELARVGLVRRVNVGDRVWRYASRQSRSMFAIFTCTNCDADSQLLAIELRLPSKVPRSVRRNDVQVHLRGLCDACL